MQYPIIDLLEDVGGESVTGKNLYSREESQYNVPVYSTDGTSAPYPDVAVWWIKVEPNTEYTMSSGEEPSSAIYIRWINCDENKGFINRLPVYILNNLPVTITTPNNCEWVQIAINEYPPGQISQNDWNIQIEEGSTATEYESYFSFTFPQLSADDIAHRLKLPMLKYYPHAVIEALQTVKNGDTLSYDQYEILQHYLTPLGIGGI